MGITAITNSFTSSDALRYSPVPKHPHGWHQRVMSKVRFASTPSDAVECLENLRQTMAKFRELSKSGDEEIKRVILNDPIGMHFSTDADWSDWKNLESNLEPFFWSSDTANLVSGAASSYPLEEEEALNVLDVQAKLRSGLNPSPPSYLPSIPRGLHVFESPCIYVELEGQSVPLSALAWNVAVSRIHKEVWLCIRGIGWSYPNVALFTWWSDGGSIGDGDAGVDGTFRAERLMLTKWVCTAAMFLQQEIVVKREAVLPRAARRRSEKLGWVPRCHVVNLRKEIQESIASEGSHGNHVEWSKRWLVRGHWRRQFFPKRGGHAPIWIHPYAKGPDDKPFSEPSPTVYAVNR